MDDEIGKDAWSRGVVGRAGAFATLGVLDVALLAALAREAKLRLSELSAQAIANTAWAFATLGQ